MFTRSLMSKLDCRYPSVPNQSLNNPLFKGLFMDCLTARKGNSREKFAHGGV